MTDKTSNRICYQDEDLSDDGCEVVKDDLILNPQVVHLHLNVSTNNIGQDGAEIIAEGLQALKDLQILFFDISHNQIGKLGAKSISESLQDCQKLQELTLQFQGGNRIGDVGLESLSELIRKQQCLEVVKIDLSYTNYISEIGMKSLINSLILHQDNLKALTLHLRNNSILDEGASHIGDQLSAFKKLQCFSISIKDNGIKNQGYFKLIEGISSLEQTLIDLHISATFTKQSFLTFCITIEKLNLKKLSLDLRMSCFNDTQLQYLSRSFQNLYETLKQVILNISENEFEDEGVLCLIKSLNYLNIFDIKINQNKLTNDGIVKMLKYVTLNMNQLSIFKFEAIEEKTNIQDNFDRRKIYLEKLIQLNYFCLNLSQIIWEEYFSQEERMFSNQIRRVRKLVAFDTNKIFK
ncbi:hypothetical protein ABPG72_018861 [Tetrahymena utriculariae]